MTGTGTAGFSGDGGLATSAQINLPIGVAVDRGGNLFIADTFNHRIRKVDPTGMISTVAGTGIDGFSGDGGLGTSAQLNLPVGVAVDPSANLLIGDDGNHRIRQLVIGTGTMSTVAGSGPAGPGMGGFGGDGGAATNALLNTPVGVALDATGDLFIVDLRNHRIRKVAGAGAATRPTITGPTDGSRLSRGSATPVTFAWTTVGGTAQYGFEHTGPGRQLANPNGTGPDPVNGFGGSGGAFVVSGTSLEVILGPSIPSGPYQVRVIGLPAAAQVVGTFSDAVTVVVQ